MKKHVIVGLVLIVAVLAGIMLFLSSNSFSVGNGNFVTLTLSKAAVTNETPWYENAGISCQQTPYFKLFGMLSSISRLSLENTFLLVSLLVLVLGVLFYYLFVSSLFDDLVGLASSFLVFFLVDEYSLLSLAIPRGVAFFIFFPLTYFFLFQGLKQNSKKGLVLSGFFCVAAFVTHLLFGFILLLSISALLLTTLFRKNFHISKNLFVYLLLVSGVSAALSINQILSAASLVHPAYGDYSSWGLSIPFGLWTLNPFKVLYSAKIVLYYLVLFLAAAWVSLKLASRKTIEDDFLAVNLVLPPLLLFTPISFILAKLVTPGVLAEQLLWKMTPFYILVPLAAAAIYSEIKSRHLARAVVVLLFAASLSQPLIVFNSLYSSPRLSAQEFIGTDELAYLKSGNFTVATDLHTAFLLPFFTGANVLASDLGYVVCVKQNDLSRVNALQMIFSDLDPQLRLAKLRSYGINSIYVNPKAWSIGLVQNSQSKVVSLPSTPDETIRSIEKLNGFEKKEFGDGGVIFTSR